MKIDHLYFIINTGCKPLYYYLKGQHFKGCYPDSDTKYKITIDSDIEDLYWVQESNKGSIHRYHEEEIRTLLGVEIES